MSFIFGTGSLGRARAWTKTLFAMAQKDLVLMSRYPVEFVASFVQVFLMIAIFSLTAFLFAEGGRGSEGGRLVAGITVYGFILFIFLSDTLWTIGCNLRREQKQGTLECLYLTPASRSAGLVARAAVVLLWTGFLCVLSTGLMAVLLGRLPLANLPLAAVILVFSLTGTFGIGFAFAAITLRVGETAPTLATLLQFAFMVVCAPFYPFAVLPAELVSVSRAVPLSYCVDAFRSALMGWPPGYPELAPLPAELGVIVTFGLVMPIVGFRLYRRAEEHVRAAGTLSVY